MQALATLPVEVTTLGVAPKNAAQRTIAKKIHLYITHLLWLLITYPHKNTGLF